ncbi:hypothetical protein [Trichlorobacter lovleyi]|uniref:hypothetical protein n=1 Tax=Trichlorobacter lovleyi TaxID=313985 RepID=UPI003D0CFABD
MRKGAVKITVIILLVCLTAAFTGLTSFACCSRTAAPCSNKTHGDAPCKTPDKQPSDPCSTPLCPDFICMLMIIPPFISVSAPQFFPYSHPTITPQAVAETPLRQVYHPPSA